MMSYNTPHENDQQSSQLLPHSLQSSFQSTTSSLSLATTRPLKAHKNKKLPPSCSNCQRRRVKCDRIHPCTACCEKFIHEGCEFADNARFEIPVQQAKELNRLRLAHEAKARENERLKALLQTSQYVKSEFEKAQPGPPEHIDSMPPSFPVLGFFSRQQPGTLEFEAAIPDALATRSNPPSIPKNSRKPMGPKSPAKLPSSNHQALESWTSNMTQQNALDLIARSGNIVRIISKPKVSTRQKRKSKAIMPPQQSLETSTMTPPEPKLLSTPQSSPVKRLKGSASFALPLKNDGYTTPFQPQQSLDTWPATGPDIELPMKPNNSPTKLFKDNSSFNTPPNSDGFTTPIPLKLESSPSYPYTKSPNHYSSFSANSSFSSNDSSHYTSFNDSPIATTDYTTNFKPAPPLLDPFAYQVELANGVNQNYTTTPTSTFTIPATSSMTGSANGFYQLPWATTVQNNPFSGFSYGSGNSDYGMAAGYPCSSAVGASGVGDGYMEEIGGVGVGGEGFTSSHGLNLGNDSLVAYST